MNIKDILALLDAKHQRFSPSKNEVVIDFSGSDLELGSYAREGLGNAGEALAKLSSGSYRVVHLASAGDCAKLLKIELDEDLEDEIYDLEDQPVWEVAIDLNLESEEFGKNMALVMIDLK